MSIEREDTISPGRQEREILFAYSQGRGVPFEDLDEHLVVDPFNTFYDDFFTTRQDRLYFAIATGMYGQMPRGKLRDEAIYFTNALAGRRRQFLNSEDLASDSEGREILYGLTTGSMSIFAAWVHGKMLADASSEFALGALSDETAVKLVFWSKLDRIVRKADRMLVEKSDPNFDPELDLDFDIV